MACCVLGVGWGWGGGGVTPESLGEYANVLISNQTRWCYVYHVH